MRPTQQPTVTEFGHIGLVVEDLDETARFLELLGFNCGKPPKYRGDWIERIIDRLGQGGWGTIGDIVNYENKFLRCYVRGPEGLIVELAEKLGGASG